MSRKLGSSLGWRIQRKAISVRHASNDLGRRIINSPTRDHRTGFERVDCADMDSAQDTIIHHHHDLRSCALNNRICPSGLFLPIPSPTPSLIHLTFEPTNTKNISPPNTANALSSFFRHLPVRWLHYHVHVLFSRIEEDFLYCA